MRPDPTRCRRARLRASARSRAGSPAWPCAPREPKPLAHVAALGVRSSRADDRRQNAVRRRRRQAPGTTFALQLIGTLTPSDYIDPMADSQTTPPKPRRQYAALPFRLRQGRDGGDHADHLPRHRSAGWSPRAGRSAASSRPPPPRARPWRRPGSSGRSPSARSARSATRSGSTRSIPCSARSTSTRSRSRGSASAGRSGSSGDGRWFAAEEAAEAVAEPELRALIEASGGREPSRHEVRVAAKTKRREGIGGKAKAPRPRARRPSPAKAKRRKPEAASFAEGQARRPDGRRRRRKGRARAPPRDLAPPRRPPPSPLPRRAASARDGTSRIARRCRRPASRPRTRRAGARSAARPRPPHEEAPCPPTS